MGLVYQVLCTGIICTMGINMGLIFAWPASTITIFGTENTTLNRPMTETEVSLLGSLSSVGALISTLTAGFMLDKLGRKNCSIVTAMSLVVFWALLAVSRQVEVVLTSVFISGISSSIFLIASVYISEICQESIRGAMTTANLVSYGIGMLLSYGLGGYLAYDVMIYIGLTMSAAGACLLFVMKDSPIHLMTVGKEKEAAQAIAFFRHLKVTDKEVMEEINTIKRSLNPEFDESTPEQEKLSPDLDQKPAEKLTFFQFMKKSKSTRQALFVNLVVGTASIFQGLVVVQIYADSLFKSAIPSASPTLCSVIMAAVIVAAGFIAAYLTDAAGRRPLMIYASIGAGISCAVLGTQMHLHWGPTWITAVFMYVFPIMYTFGAGTVPFVLMAELFLPEVKSIMSMLIVEWAWLCNFVVLFIINPLLKALGWGPVFYIFSVICFLTSVFCIFFLPETKGLTVEEIQPLFLKKKHRNHC
ncbi:facilitated trehalose transporter Tret1-like [Anticarsia gemmatalis]|uniref:facilitated trehalose transporter Tret1-like n=1 Tax=Anticarsia gemmatalis TaxID=129554 RepID=UPI003F76945C